jgi:hypothetical protein
MKCKFIHHQWRYNFPSIPNKRICKNCYKKEKLNLRTLEWTDTFIDKRTDTELVKQWFY